MIVEFFEDIAFRNHALVPTVLWSYLVILFGRKSQDSYILQVLQFVIDCVQNQARFYSYILTWLQWSAKRPVQIGVNSIHVDNVWMTCLGNFLFTNNKGFFFHLSAEPVAELKFYKVITNSPLPQPPLPLNCQPFTLHLKGHFNGNFTCLTLDWPLQTGAHCIQVTISSGQTVSDSICHSVCSVRQQTQTAQPVTEMLLQNQD